MLSAFIVCSKALQNFMVHGNSESVHFVRKGGVSHQMCGICGEDGKLLIG